MRRSLALAVFVVLTLAGPLRADEIALDVHPAPYRIVQDSAGYDRIRMEGFSDLLRPGVPRLPAKVIRVPLPAGSRVVAVDVIEVDRVELPGRFRIQPAPPVTPSDLDPVTTQACLESWRSLREQTYGSDERFPHSPVELLGHTARGPEAFARLRFVPLAYHPTTGRLEIYRSVTVAVRFEADPDGARAPRASSPERSGTYPYVIVTTDALTAAVDTLVTWKEYLGLPVNVVTDSWIAGAYPGEDVPEKVRNFLADTYLDWGIEWVLIVSDSAGVPMRECHPFANSPGGIVPTDHYYADLTGDWDSDGDGLYGEYGEDDVDFVPEVIVGRIPFGDLPSVEAVCAKLVAFESDTTAWKNQALLMGAILNLKDEGSMGRPRTDGAELMEQLRIHPLAGASCSTLYEKAGLAPCPYTCTWPLTWTWATQAWASGDYGLVSWHSHASEDRLYRKYWQWDDGDSIPESGEIETRYYFRLADVDSLDDEHPGLVFACACDTGDPDEENLAFGLLLNGAASVVAATRAGYYANGWQDSTDGGIASLDYHFFQALTDGEKAGQALFTSKEVYLDRYFWEGAPSQQNLQTFCLYGDPSLTQPGVGGLGPEIVAVSPTPNACDAPVWSEISVTFSRPMRAATITESSWIVAGAQTGPHSGTIAYDAETRTATFSPDEAFAPGEPVTAVLTDAVSSTMGYALSGGHAWTFSTLPFDGTGTFPASGVFEVAGQPSVLAAADFDGDGRPDLAVGEAATDRVFVLPNLGGGQFATPSDFPAGTDPRALAAADFDGDGWIDLAVAGGGTLSVLINDGSGGFSSSIPLAVGDSLSALAVGEIDGDGWVDLVAADGSLDTLWVCLNQAGTLGVTTALATGPRPTALALRDLDLDRSADLVCAHGEGDSLSIFYNGDGGYGPAYRLNVGHPVSAVSCGDLDGDGSADLALADPSGDRVQIFFYGGGKTFSADSSYQTGVEPAHLAIGDLDGDGDLDLVAANRVSQSITVLINDGGSFDRADWTINGPASGVVTADLDRDSDVDVGTVAARADSNVTVIWNEDSATEVEETADGERVRLALHPNTPNPFNPVTEIRFELPRDESVTLSIYDVRGRLVRTLVGGARPAGLHRTRWDGRDERGIPVASGVYLYRLQAGEKAIVRKMVLMK